MDYFPATFDPPLFDTKGMFSNVIERNSYLDQEFWTFWRQKFEENEEGGEDATKFFFNSPQYQNK